MDVSSQDMILKRGERAGQQVVQEANERAAREERLILELEERKEREARQQIKARAAVRAKLLEEVHVSRKKQIEIKEKLKVQKAEESSQHVKEVYIASTHDETTKQQSGHAGLNVVPFCCRCS